MGLSGSNRQLFAERVELVRRLNLLNLTLRSLHRLHQMCLRSLAMSI